ncbi:hypothetical protein DPMN_047450 [Dreissena polymorpha]|uniref:Uncharacterized protein n=1 Tax=Dreissena polymorpha TaxID=45954 RepID=A0A9D4HZ58_DREPO|nr:hypothetical protein DPMN_047450 [Dreissena polymorpha]
MVYVTHQTNIVDDEIKVDHDQLCIYIVGSESTFVTIRSLMPIRCLMKHFRDFQRMVWALISNQTVWMHRLILVNTSR